MLSFVLVDLIPQSGDFFLQEEVFLLLEFDIHAIRLDFLQRHVALLGETLGF